MKNKIRTILKNGFTKSQTALEEYVKYLYPLKYILAVNERGWVSYNNNSFWRASNIRNRIALFNDMANIRKKCVSDAGYFHIINRFENGDKYGIEVV